MKTNKWLRLFLSEDAGGDFGGDAGGTPEPMAGNVGEPSGEPAAPPAAPTFDADAIAAKLGDVITRAMPKQPEPSKPQLTPEEAKKLLNVWDPDDAWHTEFNNLETQRAAIQKMRDGMTKQLDTLVQLRLHELQERFSQEYSPIRQQFEQQQAEAREARFNKKYEALAQPNMKPIVHAVATSLVQSKKFSSEDEFFDAIASGVESVIKSHNPEFKLTKAAPKPTGIPVTTPGSGGGGGSNSGGQVPRAAKLFPPVRDA